MGNSSRRQYIFLLRYHFYLLSLYPLLFKIFSPDTFLYRRLVIFLQHFELAVIVTSQKSSRLLPITLYHKKVDQLWVHDWLIKLFMDLEFQPADRETKKNVIEIWRVSFLKHGFYNTERWKFVIFIVGKLGWISQGSKVWDLYTERLWWGRICWL